MHPAVSKMQDLRSSVPSNSPANTPLALPLHSMAGQSSTPRSREEIRRLFTKRSSHPADTHSTLTNPNRDQQPSSRLQHQTGTLPASDPGPHHEHTGHNPAGAVQQHSMPAQIQHQALYAPDSDFQAPPSFRQFACSGDSLSGPGNQQPPRSSCHSIDQRQSTAPTAQQHNSVSSRQNAAASNSQYPEAVLRASASSGDGPAGAGGAGPFMRAEIHMGPAATIEVNVRFHANIAAALKK